MKKKAISTLLCAAMTASMLTVPATVKAEEKPFEGETLTVLYMSSVYADAAKAIVPEFEEATGATVEVVDFPYNTLHEKALLDLTSGTGSYDVIDVASQWDGEFAPYLLNLGDFIEKDGYDTSVFIDNVLNNCGKWQDTMIGIPNASTPQLFAYRTDLLPDGVPETWEDYRKAAAELTKDDVYGVTISEMTGQLGGVFDYVLWSMGGNWADEDWNVTIDSQETRDALLHLKEMQDYINPASLSWGTEESIQAFLDGKAAVCETWPTLGLVQAADDPEASRVVGNWALDVIPSEKTGLTLLSAWDVAIPAASQKQELAWEWIKMYTSEANQERFFDEFGIQSPRKSFYEREGIKGTYNDTVREALDTANMWWRIPASTEVDTMLNTVISGYLSDQIELEDAVAQMDEGIRSALESAPPEEGTKNFNH